jgi:F-type H+-transporting ATPase subunit delta
MARRVYAKRYAQAVFSIALEKKELERWQSDLTNIARVVEDEKTLAVLENPKIHFDDKTKLLSTLLGDVNPLALNLVYLLINKDRLRMMGEIAGEYQRMMNSYRGTETAEVLTAVSLDESDKKKLGERLGAIIGKTVELEPKVDASIIGGVIARIDGKLIDGSTRSKLEALKKELAGR